jgi:tetratricopeptide (TPR) repeat protein
MASWSMLSMRWVLVYKDDLQSYHKSIHAYEELNSRFPKNKLELESFYQLYLLYSKLKNTQKADYYKEQILALYPNSTIARYLKNLELSGGGPE